MLCFYLYVLQTKTGIVAEMNMQKSYIFIFTFDQENLERDD